MCIFGAVSITYACGNSSGAKQNSLSGTSSCNSIAKAEQVSAGDKSPNIKVINADIKTIVLGEISATCETSCLDKTQNAPAYPYKKVNSSSKQVKSPKSDDSEKQKSDKAQTAEIKQNNMPAAAKLD